MNSSRSDSFGSICAKADQKRVWGVATIWDSHVCCLIYTVVKTFIYFCQNKMLESRDSVGSGFNLKFQRQRYQKHLLLGYKMFEEKFYLVIPVIYS